MYVGFPQLVTTRDQKGKMISIISPNKRPNQIKLTDQFFFGATCKCAGRAAHMGVTSVQSKRAKQTAVETSRKHAELVQ
jgi:hypothetical protein